MIFTKISQSLKKEKDVYYIPNFYDKETKVSEIIELKDYINGGTNFNILMFFDDFGPDDDLFKNIINNIDVFESSQIIRDY